MWWNVWPHILWTWPFGWILNIFFAVYWLPQVWVEFYYNAYKVINLGVDTFLFPFWLVVYTWQIVEAIAKRPIYMDDATAQLLKDVEGLVEF